MDILKIRGGTPLRGEVTISGAKNSALKLLCASLLTDQPLVLSNVPLLSDIETLSALIKGLGGNVTHKDHGEMTFATPQVKQPLAPYELVRKMRASILVLGPLMARCGYAKVSLPGGCAIGARPIDFHLRGFEAMGARIDLDEGYITATAPQSGLRGAQIEFPFPSVGATEHLMMTATLANGTTVLKNAACEPEIVDLAECLNKMGAKVSGAGTSTITINGVSSLSGASHCVVPDRIEAGSYAIAAVATRGEVTLKNVVPQHLSVLFDALRQSGCKITETGNSAKISMQSQPKAVSINTAPYPGLATDLQAQFMALMAIAAGESHIRETVYENRFMHVPELQRLGADIRLDGANDAYITGTATLSGAPVTATDLRAGFALVIAGLVAEGETAVDGLHHLDRGYERLEEKMRGLGACLTRSSDGDDGLRKVA